MNICYSADFTPALGQYHDLSPFRMWCQKVIPLVYDDSLSYYEVLCKLTMYINTLLKNVEIAEVDIMALHNAYVQLQNYVNTYFDNLDVQQEINNKLDEMASDGTLSQILNPIIISNLPPIVVESTEQMVNRGKMYILKENGHLYQWSDSAKAFVDTGVSYGTIGNVITTKLVMTEGDLNNVALNTVIGLSYPTTGEGFINAPTNQPGYLVTYQFGEAINAKMQIFYDYNNTSIWWRQETVAGKWTRWINTTALKDGGNVGTLANYPYNDIVDMNLAPVNSLISLNYPVPDELGGKYLNVPENIQNSAYVITYQWGDDSNARYQIYYSYTNGYAWHRIRDINGKWGGWLSDTKLRDGGIIGIVVNSPYYNIIDLNLVPPNTCIALNYPVPESLGGKYLNTPPGTRDAAYLFTYSWYNNPKARIQFYYTYNRGKGFVRTCNTNGVWSDWSEQNGIVYNTENNITENSYTNTYNITSTPEITTDSNGWLKSTGDSTDRTSDIMSMLRQTNYCHLGEGTFYISGQIEMPTNSMLVGCGNATILRMSPDYTGAMIIPTNYCTVKDIKIKGKGGKSTNIDGDTGILIFDTKTAFSGSGAASTHGYRKNLLSGLWISDFSGSGIELRGTGGSENDGTIITDCHFEDCSVAINLSFFTEYHKIANCIMTNNNVIGVINNGGNNTFDNCSISGSSAGFIIDNSGGNLLNAAHGTCTGCTFNHVGSNNGDAIRILGTNNGFLFSGCQLWYGTIRLDSTAGITFTGLNSGGDTTKIVISNSTGILFSGAQFNVTPLITQTNNNFVRFINCYNFLTGDVIE